MILETYDHWDIWSELRGEMNWQKNNDKDIYKDKYKEKDSDKWLTCDIWDTDYNYDNWEPEFMKIFVTWQLRVTLDSICNSCDVLNMFFS